MNRWSPKRRNTVLNTGMTDRCTRGRGKGRADDRDADGWSAPDVQVPTLVGGTNASRGTTDLTEPLRRVFHTGIAPAVARSVHFVRLRSTHARA